jgi:nucleoside-diphosphate-sugar epimerase
MAESQKHHKAEVFNLASGSAFSALDIAKTVYDAFGKPLEYEMGAPMKFWDKYEGLFDKNYNLSKERVYREVFKHCLCSPEKVRVEFGYIPKTSLKDGLSAIIEYQRKASKANA